MGENIDDCFLQFEQLLSRIPTIVNKELKADPPEDFNLRLREMYERGLFLDFTLDLTDHQTIKVHKLVLLMNHCKAIETHKDNTFPIRNVGFDVVTAVVRHFYGYKLAIDMKEYHEQILELSRQLGVESLTKKMSSVKKLCQMALHFEEVFKTLMKPSKHSYDEQTEDTRKRFKSIDEKDETNETKNQLSGEEDNQNCNGKTTEILRIEDNSEGFQVQVVAKDSEKCAMHFKNWTTIETPKITKSNGEHSSSTKIKDPNNKKLDIKLRLIEGVIKKNQCTPNLNVRRPPVSAKSCGKSDTISTFQAIKYLTQANKPTTHVWQSCFVPPESGFDFMVATVGGSIVNWFDLKVGCDLTHVFNASKDPKALNDANLLRSIAVSVVRLSKPFVIYGVGSNNCVYFFKHPTEKEVSAAQIDRFDDFKDEVLFILFHITSELNLMFCGTADKTIVVWEFKVDDNCRLMKSDCHKRWTIDTSFAVLSMVYLKHLDVLMACGESANIFVLSDLTKQVSEPVSEVFTPNPDLQSQTISSLVYIPEHNLLAFRYFNHSYIELGFVPTLNANNDLRLTKSIRQTRSLNKQSQPSKLEYRRAARLEFPDKSRAEFVVMTANANLIGCGDDAGNVFLFKSSEALKDEMAVIKPYAVLGRDDWLNNQVPKIRSVCISDDQQYVVSTTDNNMICIWKKTDKPLQQ